jgi:tripartite-type tricarboxylate transporter receptor subunit TctC
VARDFDNVKPAPPNVVRGTIQRVHSPGRRIVKPILRAALLTMAVFALGGIGNAASAEPYPSKPIHFIAPYPPGSVTDLIARTIGQKLTEKWGQPVIVENRGGGGSVIGTDVVAKAAPDGYSILMVAPDLAINESLRSKLPYDAEKSFAPVTLLVAAPMVLSVHSTLAVNNVKELIAYAKAHPGQLSYASGGNGTVAHLGMELFKQMAGVDIVHIPYKGTAAVVQSLITGEVQVAFAQMATVRPQIASGKLRVLAVATASRAQAMPDLPTVAEAGVPGYKADVWFGVVAPAGTPGDIIAKLNQELVAIMHMPDVVEQFRRQGIEPMTSTPGEFAAFLRADIRKWGELVRRTGAHVD